MYGNCVLLNNLIEICFYVKKVSLEIPHFLCGVCTPLESKKIVQMLHTNLPYVVFQL